MIFAARRVGNKQVASWRNEAIIGVRHGQIIVRHRDFLHDIANCAWC
jgi:hypothetical protein